MRRSILTLITLLTGVLSTPAAVTVQGWYPYGELLDYYGDISGNNRRFGFAFSRVGSGNAGAAIMPFGCGGPLGTTGYTSTNCLYWTPTKADAAGMWGPGGDPGYNPPATDYAIECWCLPEWPGTRGGNGAWLFCSGQGGGVRFMLTNDGVSAMVIRAVINGNNVQIGDALQVTTNKWTHLAVVNDNGTNTFYVNGVQHGAAASASDNTTPSGMIFAGSAPGTQPTYCGYLDELRITTFAPGQFALSDLLTRPPGPSIVSQPVSATVWAGGAAPFELTIAFDTSATYQWRRGGTAVGGATQSIYVLPTATLGDSGSTFDCVVTSGGNSTTSAVATLTVVSPNAANVAAYQNKILSEASLVAYFPVDNDTGATLTNVKDNTHNGTLEGAVYYDSRTNRALGTRALGFPEAGDVVVPANPAFDFPTGFGTLEAIVRMAKPALADTTILTAGDFGLMYYLIGTTKDGYSLIYSNDAVSLAWPLPSPLVGRQVHVAFVFDNGTNVTPYINGESLGTKVQPSFGFSPNSPLYIGGRGSSAPGFSWNGSVDEVAVYSGALSQTAIQVHYANLLYGTNTSAPTITSLPASKTLLAGGSPVLRVVAAGTPPLAYQWTSNGVVIAGATAQTLTLPNTTPAFSAAYRVSVANGYGSINSDPINLTFVAPAAGYQTAVLGDHPIAYWRMSEGSGTTLVDAAGFFDGTYSGAVDLSQAGVFASDTAATYNGGKGAVPWSGSLNPAGPFSIEFWAKSLDNSGFRTMFSSQNRNVGRSGYALYHHVNDTAFEVHMGNASTVTMFLYGPKPVELNTWYHVALTYDGTTARLYVDGELGPDGSASGAFNPNTALPLTFGQRTDGAWADIGQLVDEVAFYNYELTQQQVTNHWSYNWSAAAITQQPVGVTTNEWSTITMTGAASGIPNTYQWTKNGVALIPVNNSDGTAHYPNGVTSTTLVISQVHPNDAGQYRLVVSNPLGGATSDVATVAISPDTTKPIVAYAAALPTPNTLGPTPYLVKLLFSERIDQAVSLTPGNYVFNPSVAVNQVQLGADNQSAYLVTAGLTPGQKYSITVSGIPDQAQTPNIIATTNVWVWAPVYQSGMVWDFYPNIANGVANLVGSPTYPNAPYTNLNTLAFNSGEITGGDLNNRPPFGSLGDNYGCSLSGWITPTVTTNYYFYLASDDASQLHLSFDGNPANAAQIAEETSCCHGFQEPGNPTTSLPVALQAGVSYFIRALQTEGAGGDYVRVAWKMEGDPTASTNLVPIASTYLKSYAEIPPPKFTATSLSNGSVTITWTGAGTLYESTDFQNWTPVPGNPSSPYTVSASLAPWKYYRVIRQ